MAGCARRHPRDRHCRLPVLDPQATPELGRQSCGGKMHHRWVWRLLGLIAGAGLGIILIIGATHGSAAESSEERRAEQFFFWIPLYDVRGPHEEVRAVERRWEVRLYRAGAIVGGVLGLAAAMWVTRRRA